MPINSLQLGALNRNVPFKEQFPFRMVNPPVDSTRNQVAAATNDQFMRFRFILFLSFQQKILKKNGFAVVFPPKIIISRCYNHFQRKDSRSFFVPVFFFLENLAHFSSASQSQATRVADRRSAKTLTVEICDQPMSKTGPLLKSSEQRSKPC